MPKVRKDVFNFYERNKITKRARRRGSKGKPVLDITISIDGSYCHVGRDVTHCASLAVELYIYWKVCGCGNQSNLFAAK